MMALISLFLELCQLTIGDALGEKNIKRKNKQMHLLFPPSSAVESRCKLSVLGPLAEEPARSIYKDPIWRPPRQ